MGELFYFFIIKFANWREFIEKTEQMINLSKQFSEEELIGFNLGIRLDRNQRGIMEANWIFENVTKGYIEKPLADVKSRGFDIIEGNAETQFEPDSFNFYFSVSPEMENDPYTMIFGPMLSKMRKWGWLNESN